MKFYSNLTVLVILDFLTAMFARYAFNYQSTLFLLLAMVSLTLAGCIFMKMLKYEITAVLNAIWVSMSTVMVAVGSYFVFNEMISLTQGIGMAIAITGVIITEGGQSKPEAELPEPETVSITNN